MQNTLLRFTAVVQWYDDDELSVEHVEAERDTDAIEKVLELPARRRCSEADVVNYVVFPGHVKQVL